MLSDEAMRRIVERCETTGTWLLADEVYLGRRDRPAADDELLGHERPRDRDERPVEGVRDPRRAGRMDRRPARALVAECWTQHDYLTIGPNKMSDRIARVAVEPANRERCYARTREILRAQSADRARVGVASFGGRLTWREPQAGRIGLVKYDATCPASSSPSGCGTSQSTLIVPGSHVGLEGYLRIWLGGREDVPARGAAAHRTGISAPLLTKPAPLRI